MSCRQRFGYLVYPLVLFVFFAVRKLPAQNSTSTPPPTQPQTQPQTENPEANQIRLAQEAQARIRARRAQRVAKTVQDTYSHKFEVYGGGGYMRFRPGSILQHINETAWNLGFTDYLRPRLGITADFRGHYGTAWIGNNEFFIFKPSISQYTFMAGPQYRLVRREHWAVSALILGGAAKGTFYGNSANFPGTYLGLWPNGTSFSLGAAVPVDYNLGPALAVRLSPNYTLTDFGSTLQMKNLGFTTGIVYRFGRR